MTETVTPLTGYTIRPSPLLSGMTRAIKMGNTISFAQDTYDRMKAAKSPEELAEVLRGIEVIEIEMSA